LRRKRLKGTFLVLKSGAVPTPLTEIVGEERGRFQSGIGELIGLGRGIVFGSVILVGATGNWQITFFFR